MKLVLDDLARREPDVEALARALRGVGIYFAAARSPGARRRPQPPRRAIPRRSNLPPRSKNIWARIPRGAEIAVWLTLAEGEREERRLRLAGRRD